MLDWRILGASFAALIVVSAVFLGGTSAPGSGATNDSGIGGMLSGIIEKISEWFSGSPFGGFLEQPVARSSTVQIILYPDEFILEPGPIDIESGQVEIKGFKGTMDADFVNQTMTLSEEGSSLELSLPLEGVLVEDMKLPSLSLSGAKFEIVPNITADNGTLELSNFLGRMEFSSNRIDIFGNVSKLRARIGSMNWELV